MATLGANVLTLVDWAKRMDPNGKVPIIAEMLSQNNAILRDMPWLQGNLDTGARVVVRTGLPSVFWRLLNQGVQPSKSTTATIDESCGMLEAWSEVDKDLADLGGNPNGFRQTEAYAFMEAMNQEMASTFFYGNQGVKQEEFSGLSIRYSDVTAQNARCIIDAGGADGSDNASIWLIGWGENSIHGIFPRGSIAGLVHNNYGEVTVEVTAGVAGSRMRAYQERWQWKAGIALKDWRYVVRIGSIDVSNLVAASGAADLVEAMIKATHRIESLENVRPVFYMNRTVFAYLDIQRRTDVSGGGQLSYDVVDGRRIAMFRGIPIVVTDALLNTEAPV